MACQVRMQICSFMPLKERAQSAFKTTERIVHPLPKPRNKTYIIPLKLVIQLTHIPAKPLKETRTFYHLTARA